MTNANTKFSGRVIEVCYETSRLLVRYEGAAPNVGSNVIVGCPPTVPTDERLDEIAPPQPLNQWGKPVIPCPNPEACNYHGCEAHCRPGLFAREVLKEAVAKIDAEKVTNNAIWHRGYLSGQRNKEAYMDRAVKAEAEAERLRQALLQIADMDPRGQRADDLGRAARVAREAVHAIAVHGASSPAT